MIIRILSEGQFDVPDDTIDKLNELDGELEAAVEAGDETALGAALDALLSQVRDSGTPVALDELVPSTLLLPYAEATLNEVRELISGDGFIPG